MTAQEALALIEDPRADSEWEGVTAWAGAKFGRDPSVESLLFLIGIDARDGEFQVRLKKEMKQDLIMEGTYAVLATLGIYQKAESASGWARVDTVPVLSESQQERLLKRAIARYLAPKIQADR